MLNIDYIWTIREQELTPSRKWMLRAFKRIAITIECLVKNNIFNYASALTYSCMLAAIPIMAIIFAIGRGFGFDELLENKVRESLQTTPELTDRLFELIDSYLAYTHEGIFIGAGILILFYTLITLTSNIEAAFNTIWYVKSSRNIYRKIADYVSVFLLLPFAIVITSGLNLFVMTFRNLLPEQQLISHTLEWVIQFSPTLLTCTAFILLFKLMPNTEVKLRNTIWPGILTGMLFLLLQYFYFHYQFKLSSYNAIYGSLAAIPLFMLWLQITWCICLIGAQLCYANQCLDDYAFERNSHDLSRRYHDTLCLLLTTRICKRFANGRSAYTKRTLAHETKLPETLVSILLDELVGMQLLAETQNAQGTLTYYLPAIDIHRMTVRTVIRRIESYGTENLARDWQQNIKEWNRLHYLRNHNEDALLINIEAE